VVCVLHVIIDDIFNQVDLPCAIIVDYNITGLCIKEIIRPLRVFPPLDHPLPPLLLLRNPHWSKLYLKLSELL
jgi:hypothetical protein